MHKAIISFNVTKNNEPFFDASFTYHGLDYDSLLTVEKAMMQTVNALVSAGDEEVEKRKS